MSATKSRSKTTRSRTPRKRAATQQDPQDPQDQPDGAPRDAASRRDAITRDERATTDERADIARTSDGAIVEPASSSREAAEQRQAVRTGGSLGGDADAKTADEAKPLALPPVPTTPAVAPGLEQLQAEESRLRAHLVGQSIDLTSGIGQGTAQAGKAEVRTFARLQHRPEPAQDVIEHKEVAIPLGDGRELVFRETFGGHVEVLFNDPTRINHIRGTGPFDAITVLTPDQWGALDQLHAGGGAKGEQAPSGQSAKDQRSSVAEQGGDPGPAAPRPIVPR